MANDEHLAILRQGIEVWNDWRNNNLEIEPDLRDADLTGSNLNHANFSEVNLENANLSMTTIISTNFTKAKLKGVIFRGTRSGAKGVRTLITSIVGCIFSFFSCIFSVYTAFFLSKVLLIKFIASAGLEELYALGIPTGIVVFVVLLLELGIILIGGLTINTALIAVMITSIGVYFCSLYIIFQVIGNAFLAILFLIVPSNLINDNLRLLTICLSLALTINQIPEDLVIYQKILVIITSLLIQLVPLVIYMRANFGNEKFTLALKFGKKMGCWGGTTFRHADLTEVDFTNALLIRTDFERTQINRVCWTNVMGLGLSWIEDSILIDSDVRELLVSRHIKKKDYYGKNFRGANFIAIDLANANLTDNDLTEAILEKTILTKSNLTRVQALGTNFKNANLTGACIEDWNINNTTNLTEVICDYIYLRQDQQERRPSSGNFAPGEFTELFQKAQETVDLIFRNGIDWDAFAYSFKKLEVENQGAQLDVQSIEKKGDGILVVRVAVSPNADKAKIHSEFMQGYEFAAKALEAQYQARLEDKDKVINQLFSSINQLNKQLAETSGKVSIYYQPNSQFAGGIVDANTVNADQIGGNIQNNDA